MLVNERLKVFATKTGGCLLCYPYGGGRLSYLVECFNLKNNLTYSIMQICATLFILPYS